MIKTLTLLVAVALLGGCASTRQDQPPLTDQQKRAEDAKRLYEEQQNYHPDAAAPRYRRLVITIPAGVRDGVQYEEQTRTILIAE